MSRSSASRLTRRLKSKSLPLLSGWCASCGQRVESAPPCMLIPMPGRALEKFGRGIYILCDACRETTGDARRAVLSSVEMRVQFGRGVRV